MAIDARCSILSSYSGDWRYAAGPWPAEADNELRPPLFGFVPTVTLKKTVAATAAAAAPSCIVRASRRRWLGARSESSAPRAESPGACERSPRRLPRRPGRPGAYSQMRVRCRLLYLGTLTVEGCRDHAAHALAIAEGRLPHKHSHSTSDGKCQEKLAKSPVGPMAQLKVTRALIHAPCALQAGAAACGADEWAAPIPKPPVGHDGETGPEPLVAGRPRRPPQLPAPLDQCHAASAAGIGEILDAQSIQAADGVGTSQPRADAHLDLNGSADVISDAAEMQPTR